MRYMSEHTNRRNSADQSGDASPTEFLKPDCFGINLGQG